MNSYAARGLREVAREEEDILPQLTAHEAFVARRTMSLRLAALATELAESIADERYTTTSAQQTLSTDMRDVLDVLDALA